MAMVVDSLSYYVFFFFKQKTAYEMRISDWSSDVCSSDLGPPNDFHAIYRRHQEMRSNPRLLAEYPDCGRHSRRGPEISSRTGGYAGRGRRRQCPDRSEEHTSELQSLMRISYAVFCLNKKNTPTHNTQNIRITYI